MGRCPKTEDERRRAKTALRNKNIEAGVEAVRAARQSGDHRRASVILKEKGIKAAEKSVYRHMKGARTTTQYSQSRQALTPEQEAQLEANIIEAALAKRAYRPRDIRILALQILQANDPEGDRPKLSKHWTKRFLNRRNLRRYVGKSRSFERNRSTKAETVREYFEVLEEAQERFGFDEECIWAMDESPGMFGLGNNVTVVGPPGMKGAAVEQSGNC